MTDSEPTKDDGLMNQAAPYPYDLYEIVSALTYRPGWTARLVSLDRGQGSSGLTLVIQSLGYDTYNIDQGVTYRVNHYFIVPAASYGRQSWLRWVLDRYIDVEIHEACEYLVVDGQRPFAPIHAPGFDPYVVRELASVADVETTYKGERREGSQQ